MKRLILLIFFLKLNIAFSQAECNCEMAIQKLITRIENDYPGFEEKTKDTLVYNSLKKQLTIESKNIDNSRCIDILKKYTSYFKDGHIWILPNEQGKSKENKADNQPEELDVNISNFKKSVSKTNDKLEGIWKNENYTIGIKKTAKNNYTGFIISSNNSNWKPNQIKFTLIGEKDVDYYASDHSLYKVNYKLLEDYILHIGLFKANFIKQNVEQKWNSAKTKIKIDELDGFYFKKLTQKTSLLRVSSFNYPYVDRIEKLIDKNKSSIENSENLIIDIRDNGGGTDAAYHKLLPYLSSNPIRNIGTKLLSTQGLIDGVSNYRNGLIEKDADANKEKIKELDTKIQLYKENLGRYIENDNEALTIDTIEAVENSPNQIIILADKKVGSAAENFLLKSKQSKKVKILGTPTSGVLDYANAYFFKFGCDNYKLLLPSYKSLRLPDYPIDNIGIQPDIYLDKSIGDWVEYALEYIEYE